jgi:hypothetical protein
MKTESERQKNVVRNVDQEKLMMERDRSIIKRAVRLSLLVILIAQLGCGPKVSDVLSKYEGDFKKKREQFQTIAHALPSTAAEKPCASLNPPIQFNENTKQYNTEMLMYEQLLDPDAKPPFDIRLNGDLLTAMKWTGPKNPLSPSALNNSGSEMEKSLKAALDCRYLVVNRVTDLKNPIAVNEQTYTPGQVALAVSVVDLANNETVCSFTLQAQSAAATSYYYKSGESKQERLEEFAHSSMWEDARQKLIAKLKQTAGGNIEVK